MLILNVPICYRLFIYYYGFSCSLRFYFLESCYTAISLNPLLNDTSNNTPQVYKLMEDTWKWEPDDRPTFEDITQRLENMFTSSSVEEGLLFLPDVAVFFFGAFFASTKE